MGIPEEQKGEKYLFAQMFLWAFFPIVTVLSFSTLPSLVSFAWTCVVAMLFFALAVVYRRRWNDLRNPQFLKYVTFHTLFTGVAYYGLFFVGLAHSQPGNAAIIAQFEVLTSFVFFTMLRGESFAFNYKVGTAFMILGVCIVLGPNLGEFHSGDFLVLLATLLAPIGNYYSQKARDIGASESLMFVRYLFTFPLIFMLASFLGQSVPVSDVKNVLFFLIINGTIILGLSKIFWVEAIHRMSVTKALAINAATPLLTLLFAWPILGHVPTVWQLISMAPLLVGVAFLTDQLTVRRWYNAA